MVCWFVFHCFLEKGGMKKKEEMVLLGGSDVGFEVRLFLPPAHVALEPTEKKTWALHFPADFVFIRVCGHAHTHTCLHTRLHTDTWRVCSSHKPHELHCLLKVSCLMFYISDCSWGSSEHAQTLHQSSQLVFFRLTESVLNDLSTLNGFLVWSLPEKVSKLWRHEKPGNILCIKALHGTCSLWFVSFTDVFHS